MKFLHPPWPTFVLAAPTQHAAKRYYTNTLTALADMLKKTDKAVPEWLQAFQSTGRIEPAVEKSRLSSFQSAAFEDST